MINDNDSLPNPPTPTPVGSHIFVGLSSSSSLPKTYVGGDAFSWGVIGTGACWNDRKKVARGDITDSKVSGGLFGLGDVVIVTLEVSERSERALRKTRAMTTSTTELLN